MTNLNTGPGPYAPSEKKNPNPNPNSLEIPRAYGPKVHFCEKILSYSDSDLDNS